MSACLDCGGTECICKMSATIERLERDRDALAERCEKLREALREHEIKVLGVSDDGDGSVLYYCSWCDSDWLDSPEQHAPGCLAARK